MAGFLSRLCWSWKKKQKGLVSRAVLKSTRPRWGSSTDALCGKAASSSAARIACGMGGCGPDELLQRQRRVQRGGRRPFDGREPVLVFERSVSGSAIDATFLPNAEEDQSVQTFGTDDVRVADARDEIEIGGAWIEDVAKPASERPRSGLIHRVSPSEILGKRQVGGIGRHMPALDHPVAPSVPV